MSKKISLTLLQFIAFSFVLGWVIADVMKLDYYNRLYIASFSAFIGAYINDAHKVIWESMVKTFKRFC